MLANVVMNNRNLSSLVQKIIFSAAGFLAPFALLISAMGWLGTDLISAYRLFATTIIQGYFEEGWRMPFAYFWHTEHAVILILGGLALLALISQFKDPRRAETKLWIGGVLFVYICLVVPSVIFHYFVVYARLARQLMPFLVLLAAQGMVQVENHAAAGRRITRLILAVIVIQAAWNFTYFYGLNYPREFAVEAQTKFPEFEYSFKRLAFGAPVVCQYNGYIIENAKFYVTPPEKLPHVEGQLLLSALHPANALPYQYEGDPPDVRETYSRLKLRMNFYKADEQFMSETNPDWTTIKSCVVNEK
jgi:hypothetical protein